MKTVVIVEDEPDILEVLEYNLQREGFRTISAKDGARGLELIRQQNPDLVLLDLMLPGMDGLELCRALKSDAVTGAIPIIMLTAKAEEADVVLGLGLGADDYLAKPFRPKELIARIQAVLRRGGLKTARGASERIVRKNFVIDPERHEVIVSDERVDFTATEFRLLHFLATHPGRVFSREQIATRAAGQSAVVIDRTVDVHIRSIRKKLGDCRELIETVRGVGYRFQDEG